MPGDRKYSPAANDPELVLVLSMRGDYPAIRRVIEEHGMETLQECLTGAKAYNRGETTTRQLAADADIDYSLASDVLTAISHIFDFNWVTEPVPSADVSDESGKEPELD